MNKPNTHFNNAWEYLSLYHPEHMNFGTAAISLESNPKFKTPLAYHQYIDALVSVLTIGKREGYICMHVDGTGNAIHIVERS